jgi:hypothetical protein
VAGLLQLGFADTRLSYERASQRFETAPLRRVALGALIELDREL